MNTNECVHMHCSFDFSWCRKAYELNANVTDLELMSGNKINQNGNELSNRSRAKTPLREMLVVHWTCYRYCSSVFERFPH